MNILVTGGCGFIGSNFISYLLTNTDYKIVNFDLGEKHYAGRGKNLEHMGLSEHPNYKFVQGNIADGKRVDEVLKNNSIDAIVNFAAESHVDRSIENPLPFLKTNVEGTYVLLETAKRNKNKVKKFVQIGTDEVYGSLSKAGKSSKETDLTKPSSPYSASKAGADLLALSYFYTHKFPVCVTRSSNNYGAYQFPEKAIPLFITNLIDGKKVPVYGEGRNMRDWIHVDDNCKAILRVLDEGIPGEIYNIGRGNEIENIELTKIILKELGIKKRMIEFVEDRKGHDLRYSLNCEKIKTRLGWRPEIHFSEGIKETIKWYQENENWWRRLKE